jgi:cytoskeleton protein RodZ
MNEKTPSSHLNDERDNTSNSKDTGEISSAKKGEDNINDSETPKVSNNEVTQEVEIEYGDKSPGAILRQARQKGNLSIKHIADRLFLDAHVIQALEDDNYEGMPPTIFIRGYLRNYAKVLDVSEENIMAAFDQNENTSTSTVTKDNPLIPNKQASSNDLWHSVATVVVIVTLMILIALWQFYPSTDDIPSENQESIDDSWESGFGNNTAELDTESNIVDGNKPTKPGEADDASTTRVTTTTVHSPPAVVTVIEQTEITPPPVQPVENKTILLHFQRRVWMKITDKTGKQLFVGIGKADKALSLEGLPPFKIRVGNPAVDIEYQGERKNIKDYTKENKYYIIGAVSTEE